MTDIKRNGGWVWVTEVNPGVLKEAVVLLREDAQACGCLDPIFSHTTADDFGCVLWSRFEAPQGTQVFVL